MNISTGFSDIGGTFGGNQDQKTTTSGSGATKKSAVKGERLEIDAGNLENIIAEVMQQVGGAGVTFNGAAASDIFSADAVSAASGAFASKLAGELAKITGEEVTTASEESTSVSTGGQDTTTSKDSLKDSIFGTLGFDFDQLDILHALDIV